MKRDYQNFEGGGRIVPSSTKDFNKFHDQDVAFSSSIDEHDDGHLESELRGLQDYGFTPEKVHHHSSSASVSSAANSPDGSVHDHQHDHHVDDKVEKNRERNREHAKRTRLRKKEMMESMKMRLLELQREVSFTSGKSIIHALPV